MTAEPPPAAVVEAFGLPGDPLHRFPGGRGLAWRVGDAVLKPVDDPDEVAWVADLSSRLLEDGFRIPRPLQTVAGTWVADGWAAATFVAGHHDSSPGRWPELVAVCRRFHAALRGVPEPTFFSRRTDAWSVGERVAWGEAPLDITHEGSRPLLERLAGGLRPLHPPDPPRQVIHGDLAGNVLFAPGADPAVIDFSPYHRPADWALAILAVDGVAWWSAPRSITDHLHDVVDLPQLMRRAAIYRLVTFDVMAQTQPSLDLEAEVAEFAPVVELIDSLDR